MRVFSMKYSVSSWQFAYITDKAKTISDSQACQVAHGKQADRVESWNKQDMNKTLSWQMFQGTVQYF